MNAIENDVAAAQRGDEIAFRRLVEPYRRELRAHCYRMAGSLHDADDLLQESLLRAWRGLPGFEGRSSLRTWLYKVTTTASLDALEKRGARVLPRELGDAAKPGAAMSMRTEPVWLEPCPDDFIDATESGPDARYGARESVGLAFLVALQVLPAKQRAVLILRDVLGWEASECASLLDTSVASVNSALQRARETLAARGDEARGSAAMPSDTIVSSLLGRYIRAWEDADVDALVALLREDATLAMPPFEAWFRGRDDIAASVGGMVLTPAARGAFRFLATRANGLPALAAYQRDEASGEYRASAIHVLRIAGEHIAAIDAFIDPSLFARFELPPVLA